MNKTIREVITAGFVILAMVGLVLLLTTALLHPPASDLAALAVFLSTSGGITAAIGLTAARLGQPRWIRSLRIKLVLVSVLTAALALINVGFTALLMFVSTHDLALLAGLLGFSMGVSVFITFAFSRTTSQSMREVVDAVRHLNSGNLDIKVPVLSSDEVGELAAALNDMTERLDASFTRERELERARSELIRAISHDLRTPLASIRAMVESMNDGVVTDSETVKRYLGATQSEVENLSQLINDLFELSQIDAGVLELHMERSSLQDLISDTMESMSAQAAGRKLTLKGTVEEEMSPVVMDAQRVQRILHNLVQNAIRHTPADGTIHIRASDIGGEVRVDIEDTGEGIAEQELAFLFQRPDPAERPGSRTSTGNGFGLSIAKGIVDAHGGRIWVESVLGEGSVFSFTLPKAAVATR